MPCPPPPAGLGSPLYLPTSPLCSTLCPPPTPSCPQLLWTSMNRDWLVAQAAKREAAESAEAAAAEAQRVADENAAAVAARAADGQPDLGEALDLVSNTAMTGGVHTRAQEEERHMQRGGGGRGEKRGSRSCCCSVLRGEAHAGVEVGEGRGEQGQGCCSVLRGEAGARHCYCSMWGGGGRRPHPCQSTSCHVHPC